MKKYLDLFLSFLSRNWIVLLVIVAIVLLIKPVKEVINSIFDSLKSLLSIPNSAIKGVTNALGITKSEAEQNVDNTASNPYSPFSPLFYKNEQKKSNLILLTGSSAKYIAQLFYDDIYQFWGAPTFQSIIAIVNQCKTQVKVSQVAESYELTYGRQLITEIESPDRVMYFGLSSDDTSRVIEYVKKLPVK